MDSKPVEVHAAEEVEEAEEVSKGHDQSWLCAPGSSQGLGQDEQMAIGESEGSALCTEPTMVQTTGSTISRWFHKGDSRTDVRSLIEERLTWPVRAVL